MSTVKDMISAGEFVAPPIVRKADMTSQRAFDAQRLQVAAIVDRFRNLALAELGLDNHPHRNLIWQMAWDHGHAIGGWLEVFHELEQLASVCAIKPDPTTCFIVMMTSGDSFMPAVAFAGDNAEQRAKDHIATQGDKLNGTGWEFNVLPLEVSLNPKAGA